MKLRPFELALVIIFIVAIMFSLAFLSSYKAKPDTDGTPAMGAVDIWGTLPDSGMTDVLRTLTDQDEAYAQVEYRYIAPADFHSELVNALADGKGPDVILINHERLVELRSKIRPISYESFPQRDIRSRYLDGAQIFALSDGLYAYPIAVDPLMLYWNRDILAADGILEAPATWEQLVNTQFPTLIRRSADRSIERGVIAMGEYGNIKNAFGILSMLLLQAGSAGVTEADYFYTIRLNQVASGQSRPLEIAADFYTRFSKPSNVLYSWNRSFSGDREQFLGEKLALYFGYGSEGKEIERLNPNLNFDIAEVPQGEAATIRRTYGSFYGLSVLRSSDNLAGAAILVANLSSAATVQKIADAYALVPAVRTLAAAGSNDTYGRVTYKSASVAYGWLNPSLPAVDSILDTMTRDINENRQDPGQAVGDALGRLELEYN